MTASSAAYPVRRVAIQFAARGLSAALQASIIVLLARSAGIEEFGRYSMVIALGGVVLGISGLGLPTRVLRLTEADSGSFRFTILIAAIGQSLAAMLIIILVAFLFAQGQWSSWLVAGAVYSATELYAGIIQNLLFGEQRSTRIVFVLVGRRLIPAGVLAAGLASGAFSDPFWLLALGSAAAAVFVGLCGGRAEVNRPRVLELYKSAFHYWMANTWAMLQQLDVPIIGALLGSGSAGAYAGAFRLASPVHLVTSLIVSNGVPAITRANPGAERRKIAGTTLRTGAIYAGLVLLASPLMMWLGPALLGDEFATFSWVFPILFINSALSAFNQVMSAILYAANLAPYVSVSGLISTVCGLSVTVAGSLSGLVVLAFLGAPVIQLVLMLLLGKQTYKTLGSGAFFQ